MTYIKYAVLIWINLISLSIQMNEGDNNIYNPDTIFSFVQQKVTFKDVCQKDYLLNTYSILLGSLYQNLKTHASTKVWDNYKDYTNQLQDQHDALKNSLEQLEQDLKKTREDYDIEQFYYIRARILKSFNEINLIKKESLKKDKYVIFDDPQDIKFNNIFNLIDKNEPFTTYFITDMKDYIRNVGELQEDHESYIIKEKLTPLICNDMMQVLLDIFDDYYNNENEDYNAEVRFFFNSFVNFKFDNFMCGKDNNRKSAQLLLIKNFYQKIYNKKYHKIKDNDYQVFINDISAHSDINENQLQYLIDFDKSFIHFHTKFDNLSLKDLKQIKKQIYPIKVSFITFLNNYEDEFKKLNINVLKLRDHELKKNIFATIYRLYVVARHKNYDDFNGEPNDFISICKKLYYYVLRTNDYEQEPKNYDGDLKDIQNLVGLDQFNTYRLTILAILRQIIGENPENKNLIKESIPEIKKVILQTNTLNELLPPGVIGNLFDKSLMNEYIHNSSNELLLSLVPRKNRSYKQKTGNQSPEGSPVEEEIIEDPEEYNKKFIENIKTYLSIDKPLEDPKITKGKLDSFLPMLEKETNLEKSTEIIPLIAKTVSDVPKKQTENSDKRFKYIKKRFTKFFDEHITKMLKDITSPGLYNFFTYLSQSNTNSDIRTIGNSNRHMKTERLNLFTIDKLIYLHKWFDVMKATCNESENNCPSKELEDILKNEIPNLNGLKDKLSIGGTSQKIAGYKNVYAFLTYHRNIGSYVKQLYFMSNFHGIFNKFYSWVEDKQMSKKNAMKLLIKFYNLLLDIRTNSLDDISTNSYELLIEKIHTIRTELLKQKMMKTNDTTASNKYSVSYKEINSITYFLYYELLKNNENIKNLFIKDIESNFGANQLAEDNKNIIKEGSFKHNPYDFGGIAFESYEFIYYLYKNDVQFLGELCGLNQYERIKMTGFCAQALLFTRTIEYLTRETIGNFNEWVDNTMPDGELREFVFKNKGIVYAVLELINKKALKIPKITVSTLLHINDTEEYSLISSKQGINDDSTSYESYFTKLMFLEDRDMNWFVNYIYMRYDHPYDASRAHIYEAFDNIIEKQQNMNDLLSSVIEFKYLDSELHAKAYNNGVLRALLKYTRKYKNLRKIAEYLKQENRAHMVIYLTDEKEVSKNSYKAIDYTTDEAIAKIQNLKNTDDIEQKIIEIFHKYKKERSYEVSKNVHDDFQDSMIFDDEMSDFDYDSDSGNKSFLDDDMLEEESVVGKKPEFKSDSLSKEVNKGVLNSLITSANNKSPKEQQIHKKKSIIKKLTKKKDDSNSSPKSRNNISMNFGDLDDSETYGEIKRTPTKENSFNNVRVQLNRKNSAKSLEDDSPNKRSVKLLV